jgi:hypothetical protein
VSLNHHRQGHLPSETWTADTLQACYIPTFLHRNGCNLPAVLYNVPIRPHDCFQTHRSRAPPMVMTSVGRWNIMLSAVQPPAHKSVASSLESPVIAAVIIPLLVFPALPVPTALHCAHVVRHLHRGRQGRSPSPLLQYREYLHYCPLGISGKLHMHKFLGA